MRGPPRAEGAGAQGPPEGGSGGLGVQGPPGVGGCDSWGLWRPLLRGCMGGLGCSDPQGGESGSQGLRGPPEVKRPPQGGAPKYRGLPPPTPLNHLGGPAPRPPPQNCGVGLEAAEAPVEWRSPGVPPSAGVGPPGGPRGGTVPFKAPRAPGRSRSPGQVTVPEVTVPRGRHGRLRPLHPGPQGEGETPATTPNPPGGHPPVPSGLGGQPRSVAVTPVTPILGVGAPLVINLPLPRPPQSLPGVTPVSGVGDTRLSPLPLKVSQGQRR